MQPGWLERGEALLPGVGDTNIVYEGMYVVHILRWLRFFGPEQFKVICT